MNKEDYMRLPKERLAELLAERDARDKLLSVPPVSVQAYEPDCFHGGRCTNPFHDCINCPYKDNTGGITITNTGTYAKND